MGLHLTVIVCWCRLRVYVCACRKATGRVTVVAHHIYLLRLRKIILLFCGWLVAVAIIFSLYSAVFMRTYTYTFWGCYFLQTQEPANPFSQRV